jgi:hypothetical protein
LTERKPLPIGVPSGPLSASWFFVIDSIVAAGSGSPVCSAAVWPASARSQVKVPPAASTTRRVAAAISGPMPSPSIRVTVGRSG